MGQYYIIVNLDAKQYIAPVGPKFGEHAWFSNAWVRSVETLIAKGGAWHKSRLVWTGDYGEVEPASIIGDTQMAEDEDANLYNLCNYSRWGTKVKTRKLNPVADHYRYIVNHDTNKFVDVAKTKQACDYHPLPLLTDEGGSGNGGGFFDEELMGAWKRNRVSVQNSRPGDGFSELQTDLRYGWPTVGHVILLHCLVQQGRASAVVTAETTQTELIAQSVIVALEDDLFRKVVSFLL